MRIKNNKKALSTIIATLILVLLSITSVLIIWTTIQGLTRDIALSPELNCLEVKLQSPIKIDSLCYNNKTQEIEIELQRNLQDLQINTLTLYSDLGSEWLCSPTCGTCFILDKGISKTYYLKEQEKPNKIFLMIENCLVEERNIGNC